MTLTTYIIDSFTDVPFAGNPAGVCFCGALGGEARDDALSDGLMFNIAKELGLSETAFIWPAADGAYFIRYFSPKMEIDLCGHATLAAAKTVFHENPSLEVVTFTTHKGLRLSASRDGVDIIMTLPAYGVTPAEAPPALLAALGLNNVVTASFNDDIKSLLLEISDVNVLKNLAPDYAALLASHDGIDGVCVTALSGDDNFDFESRYFWPWSGTDEDPVTGAAHCVLAPYWGARLGRRKMRARQCSARGGSMALELDGASVVITAQAQMILKGCLYPK